MDQWLNILQQLFSLQFYERQDKSEEPQYPCFISRCRLAWDGTVVRVVSIWPWCHCLCTPPLRLVGHFLRMASCTAHHRPHRGSL